MRVARSGVRNGETHGRPSDAVLSGKVAYGEDHYSRISSPLQGRVVEVRAHLGDHVKMGDVLLVVDSPDIAQSYSEYVKEDSDLHYANRAFELAKDLYESKALPLKDLKQAENELVKARAEFRRAKERLLSLRIPAQELEKPIDKQTITSRFEMKSPLSGIVVERNVTPGQSVTGASDHVLFTVADLDVLQVVADVYERVLALVREGQSAVVKVEAYPDAEFPATVTVVGDVVDPATRTIKVRARVTNESHKLKPEIFASLQLDVSGRGQFLTVPREAVLEVDGKQFVYVVENGKQYVMRGVKTANISADETRVLEGLKAGERIVTPDEFRIVDTPEGFEYRYGHIPGSELLEWTEPWNTMAAVTDDRPLALVCGDQVRSAYVASVLLRMGKKARLVFGGMADWTERGYPVEKTAKPQRS